MVAKVTSMVTSDFVNYAETGYDINGMNILMQDAAVAINKILSKIRNRGFFMDDIELENIANITQVSEVLNRNIDKINEYFSALNSTFSEHYMLSKEILETMKIDIVNVDSTSTVVVFEDRVDIELNNGQIVSVKKDEVTSVKDGDSQTITHA
jgi:hypothetical protein